MAIFFLKGISRQVIALHVMEMHKLSYNDVACRRTYRNPIFYYGFIVTYMAGGYLEAERNVLLDDNRVPGHLQGCTRRDGSDRSAHIVLRVEKQEAAVSN
jgi:hypothetical protein